MSRHQTFMDYYPKVPNESFVQYDDPNQKPAADKKKNQKRQSLGGHNEPTFPQAASFADKKHTAGPSALLTFDNQEAHLPLSSSGKKQRRQSLVQFAPEDSIHFKSNEIFHSDLGKPKSNSQTKPTTDEQKRQRRQSLVQFAPEDSIHFKSNEIFHSDFGKQPSTLQGSDKNDERKRQRRQSLVQFAPEDSIHFKSNEIFHSDLSKPKSNTQTKSTTDEQKRQRRQSLLQFNDLEESSKFNKNGIFQAYPEKKTQKRQSMPDYESLSQSRPSRIDIPQETKASNAAENPAAARKSKRYSSSGTLNKLETNLHETVIPIPQSASPKSRSQRTSGFAPQTSSQIVSPRRSARNRVSILDSIDIAANKPKPVFEDKRVKKRDRAQRESDIQKIAPTIHQSEIKQEKNKDLFKLKDYIMVSMTRSLFWRELWSSAFVAGALACCVIAIVSPNWIQYQLQLSNPTRGLYVAERITNGLWWGNRCFNASCANFNIRQECTNLTWGYSNQTYPQNSDFDYFNRLFDLNTCNKFLLTRWFAAGTCLLILIAVVLEIVILARYKGDKINIAFVVRLKWLALPKVKSAKESVFPATADSASPTNDEMTFAARPATKKVGIFKCFRFLKYKLKKLVPKRRLQVYTFHIIKVRYFHVLLVNIVLAVACGVVATVLQINIAQNTEDVIRAKGALWYDHTMWYVLMWSFVFFIISWCAAFCRVILFWPGFPLVSAEQLAKEDAKLNPIKAAAVN